MRYKIKDSDGNVVNTIAAESEADALGFAPDGGSVEYDGPSNDEIEIDRRRKEREEAFSQTIDRLNNAWYDSLTQDEKDRIKAFRKAYLEYPSQLLTPHLPDTIIIDGVEYSTYVRDIFFGEAQIVADTDDTDEPE